MPTYLKTFTFFLIYFDNYIKALNKTYIPIYILIDKKISYQN